jgi:SpoIID/LytB domain protein
MCVVAGFRRGMDPVAMRRGTSFVLATALAVSLLLFGSGHPATASSRFTFYGSGYGHGLGMSQWGAYGLARMGWSHGRILTHFYRGTAVRRRDSLPKSIRIGLTTGRKVVHLTARGGPVDLRVGEPKTGRAIGSIPKDRTWTVSAKAGAYAVRNGAGALVGGRTWGGPARDLVLSYPPGSRVFVPEADAIWYDGFAYARGSIEFNLYGCGSGTGCVERLIARLGLDAYLDGLGEVPASWPMQSLEAQVVAARSYAVYAMRHVGLRRDCNCHLTDGSGDQTYIGYNREAGTDGHRWVRAVKATRRQVVTFGGAVIQAFYAASDGGHSASVQDVWHGGNPAYKIRWLTGVCDPGEWTDANPWTNWQRSFNAGTVSARLSPYTGGVGTVTAFTHVVRGNSGRIVWATAHGTRGKARVSGTELRAALGLPDDRVWINSDRNIIGPLRVKYDGLMCAPGLPRSDRRAVSGGAQQFFRHGGLYRNTRADLTVWLKGAIDREYRAVGSGRSRLGLPVGPAASLAKARALSCTKCRRADFTRGRIYWTSRVGAHALWGRVVRAYVAAGAAQGKLGFPTSRVHHRSGGGTTASFQHGRIACPSGTKRCRVTTT